MAKELVLIPKRRYEELQSKQTDVSPKHAMEDDLTIGETAERKPDSECKQTSVQNGGGLIVRKQLLGDGLPGIANRSLRIKKPMKPVKKKKTNIQWLKF